MSYLEIEIYSRYKKNKHLRLNLDLCISSYKHELTLEEWLEYCTRKNVSINVIELLNKSVIDSKDRIIEKVVYKLCSGVVCEFFIAKDSMIYYDTLTECIKNEILKE